MIQYFDKERFISQDTTADDPRFQHELGLKCARAERGIPHQWFGLGAHDKMIANGIWNGALPPDSHRPYSWRGADGLVLWIFWWLERPLDSAAYQSLARQALEIVKKTAAKANWQMPELVYISIYVADSPRRSVYLWHSAHASAWSFPHDEPSRLDP